MLPALYFLRQSRLTEFSKDEDDAFQLLLLSPHAVSMTDIAQTSASAVAFL